MHVHKYASSALRTYAYNGPLHTILPASFSERGGGYKNQNSIFNFSLRLDWLETAVNQHILAITRLEVLVESQNRCSPNLSKSFGGTKVKRVPIAPSTFGAPICSSRKLVAQTSLQNLASNQAETADSLEEDLPPPPLSLLHDDC